MSLQKPWLIALVGPTACGKTALSIKLAQELGGEIACCDSRTIYKYMDIGTAKPTAEEQSAARHHLLDLASPDQVYTVAQFKEAGDAILNDITARGKIPIVCGGTGFYARALLEGLKIPEVEPQHQLRASLNARAQEAGVESLREILRQLDPVAAEKIGRNDKFRLIRAIEVSQVMQKPFSQVAQIVDVPYRVIWLGLTIADREYLKGRVRERILQQLDQGLIEEVRTIYMQFGPTQTIMNAVTYKEYVNHIEGNFSLEQAYEEAVAHTNLLARRQLTWFRANKEIAWIEIDRNDRNQQFDHCMIEISRKMAQ